MNIIILSNNQLDVVIKALSTTDNVQLIKSIENQMVTAIPFETYDEIDVVRP
jgi:hypothetical protein